MCRVITSFPSVDLAIFEVFIRSSPWFILMIIFVYQVLQPILLSYQEIRSKPDFNKVSQEPNIKQEVLRIIDCLTGLAPACSGLSVDRTFEFLRPILEDLVNLIKVYANVTLVIISILELFVTVIEGWLCFLSKVIFLFYSSLAGKFIWIHCCNNI